MYRARLYYEYSGTGMTNVRRVVRCRRTAHETITLNSKFRSTNDHETKKKKMIAYDYVANDRLVYGASVIINFVRDSPRHGKRLATPVAGCSYARGRVIITLYRPSSSAATANISNVG